MPRLTPLLLALSAALLLRPTSGTARGKKVEKTHLGVAARRHLLLATDFLAPNEGGSLTPDGHGDPLVLQKIAFVATDVIVEPQGVTPDTTSAMSVVVKLGNRSVVVRRVGAQTAHLPLAGGLAASPNVGQSVSNFSAFHVRVKVLGYVVKGEAIADGETPF